MLGSRDAGTGRCLGIPSLQSFFDGPRTLEQLYDSLKALELKLPEDMKQELERIFPGPGIAPEAYAW